MLNDDYFRVAGYLGELLTNAFIQMKLAQGFKLNQFKLIQINDI
jgi:hypothetical protein